MHEIDEDIRRRGLDPLSPLDAMIQRGMEKLSVVKETTLPNEDIGLLWGNLLEKARLQLPSFLRKYLCISSETDIHEVPPEYLSGVTFVLSVPNMKQIIVKFTNYKIVYSVQYFASTYPFNDLEMALAKARELAN